MEFDEVWSLANSNGWNVNDDDKRSVRAAWNAEGLRPLVTKWAGTSTSVDGHLGVRWELAFATHLARKGLAEGTEYEALASPGGHTAVNPKTVDFRLADGTLVELKGVSQPGGMPSTQDLSDLIEQYTAHSLPRDLRIGVTKEFNWQRDRDAFASFLEARVPHARDGEFMDVCHEGSRIARVGVCHAGCRQGGWFLRGQMFREEQFRSEAGLSKDQLLLQSLIDRAKEKVGDWDVFEGRLILAVCCFNGYYAFRDAEMMRQMLYEGYTETDPETGREPRNYRGLCDANGQADDRFCIAVHEGCSPLFHRFEGLTLYPRPPRSRFRGPELDVMRRISAKSRVRT